jgi:hypothetical protein
MLRPFKGSEHHTLRKQKNVALQRILLITTRINLTWI